MKCMIAALTLSGIGLTAAYPAVSNRVHSGHFAHFQGEHGQRAGEHLDRIADMLELTATQRSEVATLLSETDLFDNARQLLAAHTAQAEVVHAPTFDEVAIREASAPVGAAQAELAVSASQLMHAVHAVLTEEQLALANSLHPNWRSRLNAHIAKFELSLAAWIEANE